MAKSILQINTHIHTRHRYYCSERKTALGCKQQFESGVVAASGSSRPVENSDDNVRLATAAMQNVFDAPAVVVRQAIRGQASIPVRVW
ncbi:hypothetical protein OROGR_027967 [Orobanche gracilis]